MYEVILDTRVLKDFRRIPKRDALAIRECINTLATNPRPEGSKKLATNKNYYRVRSGDYRIIYTIVDTKLIITIIKIGHRRDVYRGA